MNNILIILALTLSFSSFANDVDCDQEDNLSKLAKGITYPNCNTPENINNFQTRITKSLCEDCKSAFEQIHGEKIKENGKHLQEEFFNAALDEYKKNITNNALNALKTRSLIPTNAKFSNSINECRMKTKKDFLSGCQSKSAQELLNKTPFFENLTQELSNDVAKFLTRDPSFKPGKSLLNRRAQTCHIPEKDLLLFATSTYEEALSSEMIEYIKKIDPKKFKSINELFSSDDFIETFGDASELKVSLENHPLISGHLNSTEQFVKFMNKIPAPSSTQDLRNQLYSPDNGKDFDLNLAASCKKSFEALQESICSTKFEDSKIFTDPSKNFAKLGISKQTPIKVELASTETLIDNNIKLLELCENKGSSEKLNLTTESNKIGASLNDEQRSQTFDMFTTTKYNSELGSLTNALCEMTDKTCIKGTLTCSIYEKYKKFNTPGLATSTPADFSNNETSSLLRAMLGDTSKIDPETRRILITEGILPKEDGKFVEKPEMKESQEQFFSKMPSQQINPGSGKTKPLPGTNLASSQQARTQPSTDNFSNNSIADNASTAPSGDMSDISDLVRGSTEDLKDIQDEIKRRLGDLPKNKSATITDAKKIARDTFKNKGRKITPYQEQALAERMIQPEVPNSVSSNNTTETSPNKAAVSDTDTQLEKWKKGQKDAALMGMQGAQKVLANDAGRAPASVEAKPKDLTTVALNIAEDPKVKLSDIFASKIDQNDPETQLLKVLLKNKNNFLLQIKDMNFKIVFNDKNNFNVLLESGDRAEAERMRPQLEIFLKRLKS